MLKPYRLIWSHRRILYAVTKSDIKGRFAGSALGLLWLFLYPLLFLGSYALVYIFIFKVRIPDMDTYGYVFMIFCGLIPFLGFADAVAGGVSSVVGNSNLIKNTLFPIELIPVRVVLSAQCTQVVGLIGLIIVLLLKGKLGMAVFYIPAIWLLQILFSIGVAWILSAANVFFRDLTTVIPVVILLLMMVSPIAYTEKMIPGGLRIILYFNPLYYMIMLYQNALIFNGLPPAGQVVTFSILSFAFFSAGYFIFIRLKTVFADYV